MPPRTPWREALIAGTPGLNTRYTLADGRVTRRVYLDNSATTLKLGIVQTAEAAYMPHYGSSHSDAHFAAQIANHLSAEARAEVLRFVGADADSHTCWFPGSGATAGLNRVAEVLATARPERDVVLCSLMEHHANDLPHRRFAKVVHVPLARHHGAFGAVDLNALEHMLAQYAGRVNYVALTGVSNVTGLANPLHEAAALAHRHGALLVADAAQMAAHMPITMSPPDAPEQHIDALCFSAHKIYAPGAPGVAVMKNQYLAAAAPGQLGGGMVEDVHTHTFKPRANLAEREQAGTPNLPGIIALQTALKALRQVGMQHIYEHECALHAYAFERLQAIDGVFIYAADAPARPPRIGALSFNIQGLHHTLTAAILNDYFNIATRDGCFCAHPYVRALVSRQMAEETDFDNLSPGEMEALADLHRGMVRASFAIYNEPADIDALAAALAAITARRDSYTRHYAKNAAGNYRHRQFRFDPRTAFDADRHVAAAFGGRRGG